MADVRRLPVPVTAVWDWQMHGACREMDSEVFFHPDRERGAAKAAREARAKAVCRTCPVIRRCRAHALTVREPYGVWGGLTEAERGEQIRTDEARTITMEVDFTRGRRAAQTSTQDSWPAA